MGKARVIPEESLEIVSPLERNRRKRSSNIFREKVDMKSFFKRSEKITFFDVVYQVLNNRELRKNLVNLKEKNKEKNGKKRNFKKFMKKNGDF